MLSKELEKYIQDNLPVCNSKLELSYAIYVLLGQVLYYSPLYATTKKLEVVPHPSTVTPSNSYVVCYTWSEIYKELLTKYESRFRTPTFNIAEEPYMSCVCTENSSGEKETSFAIDKKGKYIILIDNTKGLIINIE